MHLFNIIETIKLIKEQIDGSLWQYRIAVPYETGCIEKFFVKTLVIVKMRGNVLA